MHQATLFLYVGCLILKGVGKHCNTCYIDWPFCRFIEEFFTKEDYYNHTPKSSGSTTWASLIATSWSIIHMANKRHLDRSKFIEVHRQHGQFPRFFNKQYGILSWSIVVYSNWNKGFELELVGCNSAIPRRSLIISKRRLNPMLNRCITENQSGFVSTENVMLAQDIVHDIAKPNNIVIKLDMEVLDSLDFINIIKRIICHYQWDKTWFLRSSLLLWTRNQSFGIVIFSSRNNHLA